MITFEERRSEEDEGIFLDIICNIYRIMDFFVHDSGSWDAEIYRTADMSLEDFNTMFLRFSLFVGHSYQITPVTDQGGISINVSNNEIVVTIDNIEILTCNLISRKVYLMESAYLKSSQMLYVFEMFKRLDVLC